MVHKFKFQNSFDTGPKARLPKPKDHEKLQAKAPPVRVGQYRTSKDAEAKVAELHKKGVKATLKKTKDSKGAVYVVYKTAGPAPSGADKLAQKPVKGSSPTHKPKAE
jgi:hypothetical protein